MKKVLLVFGTRPEAIKMAPLVKAFQKDSEHFETRVCVTAQHRQMLDQVLEVFDIVPEYDLNIMAPNQDLYDITSRVLLGLRDVLKDFRPDIVLVHGDTTTSTAAAIAAFYQQIPVGHVEAGLMATSIFDKKPHIKEATEKELQAKGYTIGKRPYILVTGHRRENFGEGFLHICKAIRQIASEHPDMDIVYPVHLNPNVQKPVYELLSNTPNIYLISPLDYLPFVYAMQHSTLLLTDSGGVQEEAPSLGKPVLVMRDTTERPEAVEAGTVKLVGTNTSAIVDNVTLLLQNEDVYRQMSESYNPYGDGHACERILNALR